ncbi:MAG TPA: NPCBM/NEW2 domain-containing protein [Candidatus Dormibacteraeota bacterium]|nr:NPCBM/NEW2 domain-containing protein [Candidatus Dormibacteraeota bacterium]
MASAPDLAAQPAHGPRRFDWPVWALLAGSLALHLLLASIPGVPEARWLTTWTRAAVEYGASHVSEHVSFDGPPGYLYLLETVGILVGHPLPADGSLAIRLLIRLPPMLADLATAWCLFRIASAAVPRARALLVLAAYAYNPALLLNSAVCGRPESLTSLLLLLAAAFIWRGSPAFGGGAFGAALMTQLYALAVLPVLTLVVAQRGRLAGCFAAVRGAGIALLLLLFPFYWARRGSAVIEGILSPASRVSFLSLGAHNVWWLAGGGSTSRWISDAKRVGNAALTYRALGEVLFFTAMGLIAWRLWRDLRRAPQETPAALSEACTLQLLAIYLFPTGVSGHVLVPVLVFAAALCIWRPTGWGLYAALSVAALISPAPTSIGPPAALFTADQRAGVGVSVLLIAVFAFLLFRTPDRRFRALAPVAAAGVAAAVSVVAVLPWPRTQRLSDWQPVAWWQDRYEPHLDRAVQGGRLSVGGLIFRHGIGTQANSQLTYHLNGAFRSFDTLYAVDDDALVAPKVQFRILVDGEPRFDSGTVGRGIPPGHVRVAVDGAQLLTLEALDGGDGIEGDHADWLEPMLER